MKKFIYSGVGTALITPFSNCRIDCHAFELLLKKQLDAGVDAVIVLGTTGEASTISAHERMIITKLTLGMCKGKAKVIVGCGANNTQEAIVKYNDAEDLGADGALIVTPYYNKCTQNGLIEHYRAISGSGTLPIIIYNVPSRTGVNILPETVEVLSHEKNIYGIKEASGNIPQIMEIFRLTSNNFSVFSGDDVLNNVIIQMGGAGTISVLSNIVPKLCKKMYELNIKKQYEKSNSIQLRLLPLIHSLFAEVNPIPIKAGLSYLGLCKNELRLPLTTIQNDNFEKLKKEIDLIWGKENDCV